MQIPEMNEETYSALIDIFEKNAQRLPDELRDPNVMHEWIFAEQDPRLYVVENRPTVLVVGSIKFGLSATVILLNHEFSDVGEILREIRHVIDEFSLKRLTSMVPGPVKDLQRLLERVGFRREGHLRRSTIWNGRLVGTDVYGFYKDPAHEARRRPSVSEAPAQPRSKSPAEPQASAAPEESGAAA